MKETDTRKKRNWVAWSEQELSHLHAGFLATTNSREHLHYHRKKYPNRTQDSVTQQCKVRGYLRTPEQTRAALFTRPQSVLKRSWDSIPRFDQFERLAGDFLISADWHVPKVDPDMLRYQAVLAKRHNVKRLVVLGDFFDQDDFSHWSIAGLQPRDVQFGDELVFAAQAIEDALETFETIYFLRGNHDDRILRLLRFSLDLASVFALVGRKMAKSLQAEFENRVKVSNYTFCHINSRWFAAHPATYSKIPTAVAREVAETERMSTILGNGHIWGLVKDKSGRDYAIDTGCMCDAEKMFYKVMNIKRFPRWVNGCLVLKNDVPYLYDKEMLRRICG